MASAPCEHCEALVLEAGRSLELRHASIADAEGIAALYQRLSPTDVRRRFLTSGLPDDSFYRFWATLEERGGLCIVAELDDGDRRIVAEAGFAPLPDGDAEVGMAVDPAHRGWIGPWLLDALCRHAHDKGIHNLQALVHLDNRNMLALVRHRGCAVLEHEGWGTVRLTMSTSGSHPTWPPAGRRPRVLIGSSRSRWHGEEEVHQAGASMLICNGFERSDPPCPLRVGERCPLIEGADVVVIDRTNRGEQELVEAIQALHPTVTPLRIRRGAFHPGLLEPPERRAP